MKSLLLLLTMTVFSFQANSAAVVEVEAFLSSKCTHCQKASEFLKTLEHNEPWVHIRKHYINQDKKALEQFYGLLKAEKNLNFAVPALFFLRPTSLRI